MASALTASMDKLDIESHDGSGEVHNQDTNPADLKATVENLIERCKLMNDELELYIAAVNTNEKLAKLPSPVCTESKKRLMLDTELTRFLSSANTVRFNMEA